MKIIIGNKTYTKIKALQFVPETDLSGNSIPINEYQAEICTTDSIGIGQWAELRDDLNTLWAKYWITYAEHIDVKTLKIRAKSSAYLMSQIRLPAEIWSGKSVVDAISECMSSSLYGGTALSYTLDNSFSSATLTGFVPVQECRTRLQWICYAIGAYVKTYFNDKIEILPIDENNSPPIIPMGVTYYKPSITYKDHVTAITALGYSFTAGTPSSTDEYVEVIENNQTVYYIISKQKYTLRNPDVPSGAPEHVINIEEMYLINSSNVDDILSRLSNMYFKRTEVDISIINNAQYMPGMLIMAYPDSNSLVEGYIGSCEFEFGLQVKSKMRLVPVEGIDTALLIITYIYNDIQLDKVEYLLPLGYFYSITNPYFDIRYNNHRYIYMPESEAAEGTINESGNDVTINYSVALNYNEETQGLIIISVDDVSIDNEGIVTII